MGGCGFCLVVLICFSVVGFGWVFVLFGWLVCGVGCVCVVLSMWVGGSLVFSIF